MGEISLLGRLVGFCKRGMQAASLFFFLYTEIVPISKILFPSKLYDYPLQMKFVLLWIYPDKLVLSFPLCSLNLTSQWLLVCPM
jgi:hypothetical protein